MTLEDVSPDNKMGLTFPSKTSQIQASWWTRSKINLPASLFTGKYYCIKVKLFLFQLIHFSCIYF